MHTYIYTNYKTHPRNKGNHSLWAEENVSSSRPTWDYWTEMGSNEVARDEQYQKTCFCLHLLVQCAQELPEIPGQRESARSLRVIAWDCFLSFQESSLRLLFDVIELLSFIDRLVLQNTAEQTNHHVKWTLKVGVVFVCFITPIINHSMPSHDRARSLAQSCDHSLNRLPDRVPAQPLLLARQFSLTRSPDRPPELAQSRLIPESRARSIEKSIVHNDSALVNIGRLWSWSKLNDYWALISRYVNVTSSYNRHSKQGNVAEDDTRTLKNNETDQVKIFKRTHTHTLTHTHTHTRSHTRTDSEPAYADVTLAQVP